MSGRARATVVVLGAGDLASGVAYRLHRAGFAVAMTELERPLAVRRAVSFAQAVFDGGCEVEGVRAVRLPAAGDPAAEARNAWADGRLPVIVDPGGRVLRALRPDALVDARMAKRNLGVSRRDAPVVVGLGPGFHASADVHAVVETQRGHRLGRTIYDGAAAPDTGEPDPRGGHSFERVIRAPASGRFEPLAAIGDAVAPGDLLGYVAPSPGRAAPVPHGAPPASGAVARVPVVAAIGGVVRGLIHPAVEFEAGTKIGDIDPGGRAEACFTISDKALAVGGGVLEAILHLCQREER